MEKRKLPRCKDAKTPTEKTKKPCGEDREGGLGPAAQEATGGTSGFLGARGLRGRPAWAGAAEALPLRWERHQSGVLLS